MSYVIYNKETTVLLTANKQYETSRSAQSSLTKAVNKSKCTDEVIVREDYAVEDARIFFAQIEKKVTRINLMSGKPFQESANTPWSCSPASESYWCN